MIRLSYAGGSLDTGDDIAAAVLDYAAALANHGRADTIHVPALDLPAGFSTVELLVGPASQLVGRPIEATDAAPDGAELIADLLERTRKLEQRWIPPQSSISDWEL